MLPEGKGNSELRLAGGITIASLPGSDKTEQTVTVIALREYGGVGPGAFQNLTLEFGSLEEIFDSPDGAIAALPRMSAEKEEKIKSSLDNAPTIRLRLAEFQEQNIGVVTILDDDYPEALRELHLPPPLLYYRGNLNIVRGDCVAVVGSHHASSEGISEAVRLGQNIASTGAVVVSGLARGIDSGGHVGAVQNEGKTIAVLGCGFDHIYPEENAALAENIIENGLLLSEYPPETKVSTGRLMARNRIVVGLSRATIVVEITSDKGGTSDAIKETLRQGKSLFTCFDPNVESTLSNEMGAVVLRGEDDWKMVLKYLV